MDTNVGSQIHPEMKTYKKHVQNRKTHPHRVLLEKHFDTSILCVSCTFSVQDVFDFQY